MTTQALCQHCNAPITELITDAIQMKRPDGSPAGRASVLVCPHCTKIVGAGEDSGRNFSDLEGDLKKISRTVDDVQRKLGDISHAVSRLK